MSKAAYYAWDYIIHGDGGRKIIVLVVFPAYVIPYIAYTLLNTPNSMSIGELLSEWNITTISYVAMLAVFLLFFCCEVYEWAQDKHAAERLERLYPAGKMIVSKQHRHVRMPRSLINNEAEWRWAEKHDPHDWWRDYDESFDSTRRPRLCGAPHVYKPLDGWVERRARKREEEKKRDTLRQ